MRAEALREQLAPLVGRSAPLPRLDLALKNAAHQCGVQAVGAMLVTCSDECEHEAAESFRRTFAISHLPRLKSGVKTPFRTANLGGRYEWGSVGIAEAHFATEASRRVGKLMVIKISGHVGVVRDHAQTRYGVLRRYELDSPSCGMLGEILAGRARDPVGDEIRELLRSEGRDRLGAIQTAEARLRPLLIAVISARLQARQALLEAQDAVPESPTTYLVAPAVTLNRTGRDEEILLGFYLLDRTATSAVGTYQGLGDDPARVVVTEDRDRISLNDPGSDSVRAIRDHRQAVAARLGSGDVASSGLGVGSSDPRLAEAHRVLHAAASGSQSESGVEGVHGKPTHAAAERALLGTALAILAELAPIPTALVLFGEGLIGISQIWRMQRLAEAPGRDESLARSLVEQASERLGELSGSRSAALAKRLAHLVGPRTP